jgi:predicted nuclease of predicted toxin-antitoxin system
MNCSHTSKQESELAPNMWKPFREITDEEIKDFTRHYSKKARFLIDESLGVEAARILSNYGWNAVFVADVGLTGHSDEDIYAFAWRDNRIILTHDRDFLDDGRFPPNRNPGLIVLPGGSGSTPGLERELARVMLIVAPYRESSRYMKVEVSEESQWSIRAWDREGGRHLSRRLKFGPHGEIWEWSDDDV